MKHLLLTTIAAVLLVGCGQSQPPTTDYVDPSVADYDPNKSWGLSEEEKAAEEAAKKAKPEPPTAKAPDISIHHAALVGNIEAVKQHLAAGTDVNAKDFSGGTPLHGAGTKEVTELLIAAGADVNTKGLGGMTPLHDATQNGRKEIVKLLIAEGADVNAKSFFDETPLDYAKRHPEIADLLRKHGSKSGAEDSIHLASKLGNIEAVKQHLAAGTGVNARMMNGWTALDNAMQTKQKEIADLLRKHGGKTGAELKAEGK